MISLAFITHLLRTGIPDRVTRICEYTLWCGPSPGWPDHLGGIDDAIELVFADEAELECRLLEREVVVHGVMRDLGCLVVADDGRQRGHEHQRAVDVFLDLLEVRSCSLD